MVVVECVFDELENSGRRADEIPPPPSPPILLPELDFMLSDYFTMAVVTQLGCLGCLTIEVVSDTCLLSRLDK